MIANQVGTACLAKCISSRVGPATNLEDELGDNLEGDLNNKMEDNLWHLDEEIDLEREEDNMDNFMEASGYEPKAEENIHR